MGSRWGQGGVRVGSDVPSLPPGRGTNLPFLFPGQPGHFSESHLFIVQSAQHTHTHYIPVCVCCVECVCLFICVCVPRTGLEASTLVLGRCAAKVNPFSIKASGNGIVGMPDRQSLLIAVHQHTHTAQPRQDGQTGVRVRGERLRGERVG